jgi:hypothetical protein
MAAGMGAAAPTVTAIARAPVATQINFLIMEHPYKLH